MIRIETDLPGNRIFPSVEPGDGFPAVIKLVVVEEPNRDLFIACAGGISVEDIDEQVINIACDDDRYFADACCRGFLKKAGYDPFEVFGSEAMKIASIDEYVRDCLFSDESPQFRVRQIFLKLFSGEEPGEVDSRVGNIFRVPDDKIIFADLNR